jgi:hypothetical protein
MTIDISTKAAATTPEAPPARRRPTKYIDDFGEGRVCAAGACTAVLSRYNRGRLCWTHEAAANASEGGNALLPNRGT